jgi:UDP-N-acetylglucosamine diphosphorylase/glucosamine-1-phosphate N-acetyltransferase
LQEAFHRMHTILFDDPILRTQLLPFTFLRPLAHIRIGILKISEKWQHYLGEEPSYLTQDYLSTKYPMQAGDENLFVNGDLCPDAQVLSAIEGLKEGQGLMQGETLLACRTKQTQLPHTGLEAMSYPHPLTLIRSLPDLFALNAQQIRADFELLTRGRTSQPITDPHTTVYNPSQVFLEEGASIRASILNAETGPIYIGRNATVQEGCMIRGSFALLDHAQLSLGAKMRGDTTIGPYCKVGGEVGNSVFFGYSSKAHDGYVGNSVIGEWCNLGADTNTSNMKNDYGNVKLWNYTAHDFTDTGRQFCGTMMGDHTKAGINSMFNTGTVIGISCNVFGGGFPPKFIPSFSWGGAEGMTRYQLEKVLLVADRAMQRRNLSLSAADEAIFRYLYSLD